MPENRPQNYTLVILASVLIPIFLCGFLMEISLISEIGSAPALGALVFLGLAIGLSALLVRHLSPGNSGRRWLNQAKDRYISLQAKLSDQSSTNTGSQLSERHPIKDWFATLGVQPFEFTGGIPSSPNNFIASPEARLRYLSAKELLSTEDEDEFYALLSSLNLPKDRRGPLERQFSDLKMRKLSEFLDGRLHHLATKAHLSSDDEQEFEQLLAESGSMGSPSSPFQRRLENLSMQYADLKRRRRRDAVSMIEERLRYLSDKVHLSPSDEYEFDALLATLGFPEAQADQLKQRYIDLKLRAVIRQFEEQLRHLSSDLLSSDDEQDFNRLLSAALAESQGGPLHDKLNDLKRQYSDLKLLRRISRGDLPVIQTTARLLPNEVCHYETAAIFFRETPRQYIPVDGTMLITSMRVLFISSWKTLDMRWSDFARVFSVGENIRIELLRGVGTGQYQMRSPAVVHAMITLLLERGPVSDQEISDSESDRSRRIPQEVISAVWRRDGGRCVQCHSMEKLQLDHIIPFSKGGANTVENLQILCQACNLKKSNHI